MVPAYLFKKQRSSCPEIVSQTKAETQHQYLVEIIAILFKKKKVKTAVS
jgi:hypothetical protein